MTRANLYATLNNVGVEDVTMSPDEWQEYIDRAYVLLVELARVADDGVNPKLLIRLVSKHPAVANRAASALDQTVFELENMTSPWIFRDELLSSHKNEVQILRSILSRNTANGILCEIESE